MYFYTYNSKILVMLFFKYRSNIFCMKYVGTLCFVVIKIMEILWFVNEIIETMFLTLVVRSC